MRPPGARQAPGGWSPISGCSSTGELRSSKPVTPVRLRSPRPGLVVKPGSRRFPSPESRVQFLPSLPRPPKPKSTRRRLVTPVVTGASPVGGATASSSSGRTRRSERRNGGSTPPEASNLVRRSSVTVARLAEDESDAVQFRGAAPSRDQPGLSSNRKTPASHTGNEGAIPSKSISTRPPYGRAAEWDLPRAVTPVS